MSELRKDVGKKSRLPSVQFEKVTDPDEVARALSLAQETAEKAHAKLQDLHNQGPKRMPDGTVTIAHEELHKSRILVAQNQFDDASKVVASLTNQLSELKPQ